MVLSPSHLQQSRRSQPRPGAGHSKPAVLVPGLNRSVRMYVSVPLRAMGKVSEDRLRQSPRLPLCLLRQGSHRAITKGARGTRCNRVHNRVLQDARPRGKCDRLEDRHLPAHAGRGVSRFPNVNDSPEVSKARRRYCPARMTPPAKTVEEMATKPEETIQ